MLTPIVYLRAVTLAGALILLLLPLTEAWAQDTEPAGRVEALQGRVALLRDGGAVAAVIGTGVLVGDEVVTGEASKVRIALTGGGSLTAGPGSRLSVDDYARADDAGTGVFGLVLGIVRASLSGGEDWDRFDVQSRTAVASARGTEFVVEATPGNTAVFTVTGAVGVTGRATAGEPVVLRAGEGTDVARGAAPKEPVTWGDARVRDTLARTTLN